jgi:L-glyceraldehyde 3-phosphate reductase
MDPDTPLEETMGALATAVTSGKALYVGLSNYDTENLDKAEAILRDLKVPFIINQNKYNILDRTIEDNGIKEESYKLGKGIIAFSPLEQGLLTDKYINGIPEDSRVRRSGIFLKESDITSDVVDRIKALNAIASYRGQSLAEMALSWILKDDRLTSVLIGASRPEHIAQNAKIVGKLQFTPDELAAIDVISLGKNKS